MPGHCLGTTTAFLAGLGHLDKVPRPGSRHEHRRAPPGSASTHAAGPAYLDRQGLGHHLGASTTTTGLLNDGHLGRTDAADSKDLRAPCCAGNVALRTRRKAGGENANWLSFERQATPLGPKVGVDFVQNGQTKLCDRCRKWLHSRYSGSRVSWRPGTLGHCRGHPPRGSPRPSRSRWCGHLGRA